MNLDEEHSKLDAMKRVRITPRVSRLIELARRYLDVVRGLREEVRVLQEETVLARKALANRRDQDIRMTAIALQIAEAASLRKHLPPEVAIAQAAVIVDRISTVEVPPKG